MTVDDRRHAATPRGWRVLAGGLVAALAFGYTSLGVTAQEATPGASPVAAECVAPELAPGTPTPMDDMASPEGEAPVTEATAEGTPEPAATPDGETEEAAPVAPEAPVGTPAEGDEGEEIIAAVENLIGCVNGGNTEGAAALLTTDYMMAEFGTGNPYDVVMFLEGFSFGEVTVDNPQTYEDGSVSADIQYQGSQYQITKERWYLVDEDGTLKLNDDSLETPEFDGDTAVIGVLLGENEDGSYYITPAVTSVTESEGLILHGKNEGVEPHEIVAFALPEGADPAGLLDGSIAEEDVEFYGQISLNPGEEGDLLLVGLPAGVMTLVCFFPGPDGAPHAMNGMISEIEITAVE